MNATSNRCRAVLVASSGSLSLAEALAEDDATGLLSLQDKYRDEDVLRTSTITMNTTSSSSSSIDRSDSDNDSSGGDVGGGSDEYDVTPRLELHDIQIGTVLGSGQFGLVCEILSITNCPASLLKPLAQQTRKWRRKRLPKELQQQQQQQSLSYIAAPFKFRGQFRREDSLTTHDVIKTWEESTLDQGKTTGFTDSSTSTKSNEYNYNQNTISTMPAACTIQRGALILPSDDTNKTNNNFVVPAMSAWQADNDDEDDGDEEEEEEETEQPHVNDNSAKFDLNKDAEKEGKEKDNVPLLNSKPNMQDTAASFVDKDHEHHNSHNTKTTSAANHRSLGQPNLLSKSIRRCVTFRNRLDTTQATTSMLTTTTKATMVYAEDKLHEKNVAGAVASVDGHNMQPPHADVAQPNTVNVPSRPVSSSQTDSNSHDDSNHSNNNNQNRFRRRWFATTTKMGHRSRSFRGRIETATTTNVDQNEHVQESTLNPVPINTTFTTSGTSCNSSSNGINGVRRQGWLSSESRSVSCRALISSTTATDLKQNAPDSIPTHVHTNSSNKVCVRPNLLNKSNSRAMSCRALIDTRQQKDNVQDSALKLPHAGPALANSNSSMTRNHDLPSRPKMSISRSMSCRGLFESTGQHNGTQDATPKLMLASRALAHHKSNTKAKKWKPYVIKTVQKGLKFTQECLYAADILEEARILTIAGWHENLVSLRATVGRPGSHNFAIVLDRVHEVLDDTIAAWKAQAIQRMQREGREQQQLVEATSSLKGEEVSRKKKFFTRFKGSRNDDDDTAAGFRNDGSLLTAERVLAMYDVANGLAHLHRRRIIYRDLKPANIGVDIHSGRVKLFDFGTAVYLDSNRSHDTEQHHALVDRDTETYRMTNEVGTRRYMAPEVARKDTPYGFKADVYSFAILFWQVMALQLPFDHLTSQEDHYQRVVIKQERPPSLLDETTNQATTNMCPDLPSDLNDMMEAAWSDSPAVRPSFNDICQSVQAEYF